MKRFLVGAIVASMFGSVLIADAHGVHWGYEGNVSAEHWGDLEPAFVECKNGHNQSPVNIVTSKVKHSSHHDIKFNYITDATKVVNNGHTIQLNVADGSSITVGGKEFALKQFHFHTRSENHINGKSFPLEAHFVHAAKDGQLAVVGVMFENGSDNLTLRKIWTKMPHKADTTKEIYFDAKDINSILPKQKDHYEFMGSLTTPPCSENVRWFVMKNFSHISSSETREFLHTMHHKNNRPVQDLFNREIND